MYRERNLRIHLSAVCWVTIFCLLAPLSFTQHALVALCCGIVVVGELFNSAIEELVDLVSPHHNTLAGRVKDVAAAAVLVTAILAVVVGYFIFIPTGRLTIVATILLGSWTSFLYTILFIVITGVFIFYYPNVINKLFIAKQTDDIDPLISGRKDD